MIIILTFFKYNFYTFCLSIIHYKKMIKMAIFSNWNNSYEEYLIIRQQKGS